MNTPTFLLRPSLKGYRRIQGFSVVELVVVVGIMTILSATMLFNYGTFNARITLDNKAHEIAQWVREAQVYAMGVKSTVGLTGSEFTGFGVHFEGTSKNTFLIFSDRAPGNKVYDVTGTCGDAGAECIKDVSIYRALRIRSIVGVSSGVPTTLDKLDVSFTRPNPDATITGTVGGLATVYDKAEITIESSTKTFVRTVDIWSTGQISVR